VRSLAAHSVARPYEGAGRNPPRFHIISGYGRVWRAQCRVARGRWICALATRPERHPAGDGEQFGVHDDPACSVFRHRDRTLRAWGADRSPARVRRWAESLVFHCGNPPPAAARKTTMHCGTSSIRRRAPLDAKMPSPVGMMSSPATAHKVIAAISHPITPRRDVRSAQAGVAGGWPWRRRRTAQSGGAIRGLRVDASSGSGIRRLARPMTRPRAMRHKRRIWRANVRRPGH
jgi:hypothetical protein